MPLRSSSRVGIEAEPASASRTAEPSIFTSSTVTVPWVIFNVIAILSKGVRPVRNSLPPDSGRRSSRRSNCSTLRPASAPFSPIRLAVPFRVRVTASTLSPLPSTAKDMLPVPSSRCSPNSWPRQLSRSTSENCNCDFTSTPAVEIGERQRALDHAAIGLRLADGHHQVAGAQICADRSAAELSVGHHDVRGR